MANPSAFATVYHIPLALGIPYVSLVQGDLVLIAVAKRDRERHVGQVRDRAFAVASHSRQRKRRRDDVLAAAIDRVFPNRHIVSTMIAGRENV